MSIEPAPRTPDDPAASGSTPPRADAGTSETVVEQTVGVHRSPRYFNFMLLGALVGVVAALILTFAVPGGAAPEETGGTVVQFSTGQVFGFLLLICVPIGVALGAIVAIVLDRSSNKRTRTVRVAATRVDRIEEHSEPQQTPGDPERPVSDADPAVRPPTTEGPAA